jgi:GT2 family glycosyltransferase
MESLPRVRVVIINYDGGQMTIDCLDSLVATDWPADRLDIVMVDNGSLDDVVTRVGTEFPMVTIIEPLANTGFAGGCNLGINAVGPWDYVALVNNDATVDLGWLRAMVPVLESAPDIGAVNAKLLFADRYYGVDLAMDSTHEAARVGGNAVGIRVSGVRLDDERADSTLLFDEGFYAPDVTRDDDEEFARWMKQIGTIRVADTGQTPPKQMSIRVSSPTSRRLTLTTDSESVEVAVGPTAQWVTIKLGAEPYDVINNAGSNLYRYGFGGDRGFLERDRGQFTTGAEVFAWCGAAVLMKRAYIDDIGIFDERLFLYYEDTDLSWRGRLAGWRYLYVPDAVVRHRHAASSGVGSQMFRFHTERNRILINIKLAPARSALTIIAIEIKAILRTILNDVGRRSLGLHPPVFTNVKHRARVVRSIIKLTPGMLRDRRAMKLKVPRSMTSTWEMTK